MDGGTLSLGSLLVVLNLGEVNTLELETGPVLLPTGVSTECPEEGIRGDTWEYK